ncbi:MAG: helicase HerA-like domain-containing protein [Myxococcota bacterium]
MSKLTLGRECDPKTLEPDGETALLDTRKLTRHGVLLGMTGSGKTGLGVCLLEEIAMSGVPIIAVDPKGDLTNLALAFPNLAPTDFAPWIDPAEAKRKGVDIATRATQVADMWRSGHESWGVTPENRQAFANCNVTIYTPGSTAGVPVDVLSSLRAPSAELREDVEGLTELATGTVSALLGLVGVQADPFRDPEAIVLTQVLHDAWGKGEDLTLETVLTRLVDPPFGKIGVFPVDTFFPKKKRLALAMKLNAVIASPAFAPWSQGVPMDLDAMLTPAPNAPIHVFTTAHLSDDQRIFFLSTLLNAFVAWSRRQPGTGDLRALLYMDEVYGYLPPHPANPPTKRPILTLMKQARAVGVGVVLATQNPVDLDYKALSNAGTWLVGRIQTEQDRERVIEGLAGAGGALDTKAVDGWVQQMPGRTFVHRDAGSSVPRLLHSRWAISYLRGPLTRREIEKLPQAQWSPASQVAPAAPAAGVSAAQAVAAAPGTQAPAGCSAQPPPMPDGIEVRYLSLAASHAALGDAGGDLDVPRSPDGRPVWVPALYVKANLRFDESTTFSEERRVERLFVPLSSEPGDGIPVTLRRQDLDRDAPGGWFMGLPEDADEAREIQKVEKALTDAIYRTEVTTMYRHKGLKLTSQAGESEAAFGIRVRQAIDERIADKAQALKDRIEKKVDTLQDRMERKQADLANAEGKARSQQTREIINVGETIFGMFFGGRSKSLSTAATRRGQTASANQRVSKLGMELAQLQAEVMELQVDLTQQLAEIQTDEMSALVEVEATEVGLEKNDIDVESIGIVWVGLT